MQTVLTLVLLAIAAALPVSLPKVWTPRERTVAAEVTAAGISSRVRFLADDLLEGRGPGSKGSELAMAYVSSEYEKMGLKPLGDSGTYLQRFDIVGMKSALPVKPTLKGPAGTLTLDPPNDSIVVAGSQTPKASLSDVELVFCGYGITAPEQKWNDFKDVDLKGKILVVMNNDPESDPALFGGKARLYYGRWTYKFEEAARKGAAGLILIHTTASAGYPWQVVQTSWTGEDFELPAAGEPRLAVKMWATEDMSRKIVALGGRDLDELRKRAESREFVPVPLGVKLSVQVKTELRTFKTANVLGLLPGSDAKLGKEMVVMSAHHDHLGVKEPKGGDAIYNGALDNASGVAALLTAAQAMTRATPVPRRSILFAAVGVEESGLLGSQYFCAHPPVPPSKLAANFNIDGINIWGRTRDLEYVGLGKSSLDEVVIKTAREQGRKVLPDQFPDRGHFYRSDQFNFARIGVPAAYLGKGTDFIGRPAGWGRAQIDEYVKTRYHQPSDHIDASWNLEGAVDDLRLIVVSVLRTAELPAAPTWKPGDEFEAARKRARALFQE